MEDSQAKVQDKPINYMKKIERVVLCTTSTLKKQCLQNVLCKISLFDRILVDYINCNNAGNPEQPINSSEKCAFRRIEYAQKNDSIEDNTKTLYVAIESGMNTDYDIKSFSKNPINNENCTYIKEVCSVVTMLNGERQNSMSITIDVSFEFFKTT